MSTIQRIALVGLPGSGKTTVAPLLAERLGWSSVDLDDEVAAVSGRSPAAIIAGDGEAFFRQVELAALQSVLQRAGPVVIACGGGVITQAAAQRTLTDACAVVWLDAPDAVLVERLGDVATRPLLEGSAATVLPRLRAERAAAHHAAHLQVSSDDQPEAVASRIAAALDGAVTVDVSGRSYCVEVRPGAIDDVVLHIPAGAKRVALVADRAVGAATSRLVAALRSAGISTTLLPVSGGEPIKTWTAAGRLLARLGTAALQRNDCVIALGGGTVGDLAGFAAATYLRGVAWINVPTTLLAMVDSALGGKTGVNLARGKNQAGAIWQPHAVICDPNLLGTQDDRSFRSAFAEIVKYSMIAETRLSADLDARLDRLLSRDPQALADVVRECCAIKARVVAFDERDRGERAVLNYGHTVGHALEAAAGFGERLLHGEAVAVGMSAAGRLSIRELGCPVEDIDWQDEMIIRCGLGTSLVFEPERVLEHMRADKKMVGDRLGWVLLDSRGHPRSGQHVPEPEVRDALHAVLAR
ncbi:MAG TPA: 3-dehydroquinate synthase [Candidatus Dormibacteraeota bacterium]|jgi:shikimate kinase/3-dehydroquinate synthase